MPGPFLYHQGQKIKKLYYVKGSPDLARSFSPHFTYARHAAHLAGCDLYGWGNLLMGIPLFNFWFTGNIDLLLCIPIPAAKHVSVPGFCTCHASWLAGMAWEQPRYTPPDSPLPSWTQSARPMGISTPGQPSRLADPGLWWMWVDLFAASLLTLASVMFYCFYLAVFSLPAFFTIRRGCLFFFCIPHMASAAVGLDDLGLTMINAAADLTLLVA